jgi:hypothetical protein
MLIEVPVSAAVDTFSPAVWLEGDGNKTGKLSRAEVSVSAGTGCVRKLKGDGVTKLWDKTFEEVASLEIAVAGWYQIGMLASGYTAPAVVTLEV